MATGPTPWPKRGDGIGYSGHKHQKGDKVIAIIDHHGYVLAPVPVAPVNETDMVLLPEGLKALKEVAKEIGLDLQRGLSQSGWRLLIPHAIGGAFSMRG